MDISPIAFIYFYFLFKVQKVIFKMKKRTPWKEGSWKILSYFHKLIDKKDAKRLMFKEWMFPSMSQRVLVKYFLSILQGCSDRPAQPAHGLAWILEWDSFALSFYSNVGNYVLFFSNFNIFFYKIPSFLGGNSKNHMDNIRRVGVGEICSIVGRPEDI